MEFYHLCCIKDLGQNKVAMLTADASRLTALFVAYRLPVCALLAPGQPGASTPRAVNPILTRAPTVESGEGCLPPGFTAVGCRLRASGLFGGEWRRSFLATRPLHRTQGIRLIRALGIHVFRESNKPLRFGRTVQISPKRSNSPHARSFPSDLPSSSNPPEGEVLGGEWRRSVFPPRVPFIGLKKF